MKHFSKIAFLFSLFGLVLGGCSSGGDTTTPPTPSSVEYKANSNYKYQEHMRDTSDQNMAATDTITATVRATGQSYDGETGNVTIIDNAHSSGMKDTTYIAQKSGAFWHHNFGLEGFSSFLKGSLGWVLQAKFDAKAGETWVAKEKTSVPLSIAQINVDVSVSATQMADTTMKIGSEVIADVKHVVHTVSIFAGSTQPIASSNIDTYVSSKYGVIATVRHSTSINHPLYSGKVPGSEMMMTSHP
jgi:hypothetical protein